MSSHFWRPEVRRDIAAYVGSRKGNQHVTLLPKYPISLSFPLTGLFARFAIDFEGRFQPSKSSNRFALICVDHRTGWPISKATTNATAEVLNKFVAEEIIHASGPPETIISDNDTCFTANTLASFMEDKGINWKTVLAYILLSNGRVGRMVGSL